MLRWALQGWLHRRTDHALLWVAARLPHRLTAWVLAHVAAATLRPDEIVGAVPFMELSRRWDHRELQGRAAERHRRPA